MSTVSRPTPDPITSWRIQQVAEMEHRSLANALHILVAEAWNARLAKMLATAAPNMPKVSRS
jgi:hypothetical protein